MSKVLAIPAAPVSTAHTLAAHRHPISVPYPIERSGGIVRSRRQRARHPQCSPECILLIFSGRGRCGRPAGPAESELTGPRGRFGFFCFLLPTCPHRRWSHPLHASLGPCLTGPVTPSSEVPSFRNRITLYSPRNCGRRNWVFAFCAAEMGVRMRGTVKV